MQVKRPLKIYVDENMAPQLARALNVIQEHLNNEEKKPIEVYSIKDAFNGRDGVEDEEWIPVVGEQAGIVITQDRRIQHSRNQRELYMKHGCGIIFLKSPKGGMTFWQMFKHLVKWWDDIKKIARQNKPPFSFRQPGNHNSFVEWHGED
ncbi:MAG: hypothetical protein AB7K37_11600 [Cyclobacteriaceae bacterium]